MRSRLGTLRTPKLASLAFAFLVSLNFGCDEQEQPPVEQHELIPEANVQLTLNTAPRPGAPVVVMNVARAWLLRHDAQEVARKGDANSPRLRPQDDIETPLDDSGPVVWKLLASGPWNLRMDAANPVLQALGGTAVKLDHYDSLVLKVESLALDNAGQLTPLAVPEKYASGIEIPLHANIDQVRPYAIDVLVDPSALVPNGDPQSLNFGPAFTATIR